MIKEKLDFYRAILLERKKYILNTIELLTEISQVKEAEADSIEKYSNHIADQSSDTMGKEDSFMLISRELLYLNRIDEALKSIDIGDYGTCKTCGKEIPHERLEAVPTTDTCINCKNIQAKTFILN